MIKMEQPIVNCADLAYVLCNLKVGDGNIYCYSEKANTKSGFITRVKIVMTCIDREYVESFNQKIYKFAQKKRPATIGLMRMSKYGRQDLWRVQITCKKWVYEWVKSRTDEFLAELWRSHPKPFLQSWFDSDGSIVHNGKGRKLVLTNSNKKWLEFAQLLLKEVFGIEMGLYFNQDLPSGKTQWDISTGKKSTIALFYEKIGFGIIRKQETLRRASEN